MSMTGIVTRNWRLKIAALALAVLLWVTIRLSDQGGSRLTIPDVEVRVEQLDPGWVLTGPPSPARVEMTVTGPYGELLRAALAKPEVVIPLETVEQEDLVLGLASEWVRNVDRTSVGIEEFAPSTIRLLLERNIEVEIPVSVRPTGRLPDSLALVGEPRANLLFVQVEGPASAVDPLETVFLQPFDLGGVTGSGRFEVGLDTAGLGRVTVKPLTAMLSVDVAPRQSWVLGELPVEFPEADADWVIDPGVLEVTLFGAELQLSAIDVEGIRVAVTADAASVRLEVERNGEARVPVGLSGLTRWVEGAVEADSVTVRRAGPP
ncbi:MAG: YbbR-like domain-containing protein [Gemmatimonadetes bacterium]|nr:YbbR-like domain-containing protein [Gemmatimonadota bacterium]MXX33911.1 YbbR-like domain-containing protein [Gemmatimonadota bacterium]MYD14487.1 YbbR-like domain-containing protein [Gemmatimonadota bacterium]MYI65758.1 YbbR-like domain-containing protein [Gemmatimonadota bacterium]